MIQGEGARERNAERTKIQRWAAGGHFVARKTNTERKTQRARETQRDIRTEIGREREWGRSGSSEMVKAAG